MPRTIEPLLRQMYERTNPNVCEFNEIARPDVGQVLRRWNDQFSINPPRLSETPASTTQPSPGGGLMLKATASQVVNLYTSTATNIPLSVPDPSKIIRGVGWALDGALKPLRIRSVTVRLHVSNVQVTQFVLQIYRMRSVPGRIVNPASGVGGGQITQYTPTPLLGDGARLQYGALTAPNDFDVTWDLSAYQLDIEHRNVPPPSLSQVGEIPELIFSVYLTNTPANGAYTWLEDTASTRTIAGLGTFQDVTWDKRLPNGTLANPADPSGQWTRAAQAQVPCIKISVDTYPATSQEVYAITLPSVPIAASTGRIKFIRENPAPVGDGSATLELSTTSSSTGFSAVTNGDIVAVKQTNYWLRSTMNASADGKRSPVIEALGIEFATLFDVSAEITVEPIPQDVNVPFLDSAIGEGKGTVVRTGRRDYHDPASDILTAAAATQLIVDQYLGSRHPAITRDKWLHLARYIVSAAQPGPTSEILSLISYAKITKRKIPLRSEVVSAILAAITGTTATAIKVTGPLPATSVGDEYDNLNYYVRIASTAVVGLAPGMPFNVAGNTGTNQIDLVAPGMPAALAIGDTFELHSSTFQQPKLSWTNADPADVWYELFTTRLGVPPEKIGRADLGRAGRSGLPPKLADRAPADTATQNKLRVSRTILDQFEAKTAIDALSFLMQGTTLEIGGQIVFRPIYQMRDPVGNLVIPPEEIAATFDVRDIATLDTPRGLESRITTMACTYGVDSALGNDAAKPSTVVFSDGDAVNWFLQQDLEELGNSQIPDEIAAWCYNTYDGGLYLASLLCQQVVLACSTGMRLWSWTTVDMHPELCVGDRVIVMTDQYTDFDPSAKVAIRGLWAYTLVLVHVARNGREFRGLMLGLSDAVQVRGGSGGVSTGEVGQPSIGNINITPAGELLVSVNQGNPSGGGFRLAASGSAVPTDATVDATAFISGTSGIVNLGGGWTVGATVYVSVIAYASSASGAAKSIHSLGHVVVPPAGGGTITVDTLSQTPNYGADTVSLAWVGHGAITSYDVYVYESATDGFGALPSFRANVGASPYVHTLGVNIQTGPRPAYDAVAFYVVAKDAGGHAIATSSTDSSGSYGYQPFI